MEGISECAIHCHGLKIFDEIIVGVESTGECGMSGGGGVAIVEVGVIVGSGGGKGVERLEDKVFDLGAVQIEVIFEMEEDVEWGYYCALSVSSVLLLLLRIDCFMCVGGRGRGCR